MIRNIGMLTWLLCAGLFAGGLRAEELKLSPQEETEAKESAAEDEANIGKEFPGGHEFIATGLLSLLDAQGDQTPAVLGSFTADNKTYSVKLATEALRADLKKFNGKTVPLGGKLRNQGRYFIVEAIMNGGGPTPISLTKKKGL